MGLLCISEKSTVFGYASLNHGRRMYKPNAAILVLQLGKTGPVLSRHFTGESLVRDVIGSLAGSVDVEGLRDGSGVPDSGDAQSCGSGQLGGRQDSVQHIQSSLYS